MVLHTMTEATAPQVSGPPALCPKCQAALMAGAKFCEACGARIGGMLDAHARARSRQKARTVDGHDQKIREARRYILLVAILQTVFAAIFLAITKNKPGGIPAMVWGLVAVGICFFACWFWARSNAFAATLTALILYATLIIAGIAINPATAVYGWWLKALIIYGLVKGVRSALAARIAAADESQP